MWGSQSWLQPAFSRLSRQLWGRRFRLPTARSTNATRVESLPDQRKAAWPHFVAVKQSFPATDAAATAMLVLDIGGTQIPAYRDSRFSPNSYSTFDVSTLTRNLAGKIYKNAIRHLRGTSPQNPAQRIETYKQREQVGDRYGVLVGKGRKRTPPETGLMRLLALLIEDYDRRHGMPPDDSTPAERLQFLMVHSVKRAADFLPIFGQPCERSHQRQAADQRRPGAHSLR